MRILVVVLLLFAAAAAWWFTTMNAADTPMPDSGAPSTSEAPASAPVPREPDAPAGGNAVPTVTSVPPRAAEPREPAPPLAAAPTAHVRVVDHGTRTFVTGASVRRVHVGDELAVTDERGFARLPLSEPEQLAVVREGYLLRLVPARVGTTEADPQQVELVRDEWSPRLRFAFRAAGRTAVGAAFVRFRPTTPPAANAATPVVGTIPTTDAFLQRAWTEHGMLAGRPVCADVPVEMGAFAEGRVHRLADRQELRFVAAGDYECDAATLDGFVGRTRVHAVAKPGIDAPLVTIELVRGGFVAGTVLGAETKSPLAAATVALEGGDPLGLVATTTAAGTFRLGPSWPGPSTLHVRHGDHQPRALAVTVPSADVPVELQPLPRTSLRGRVRARPELTPLAGATVSWAPAGSAPITATTGADGTFVLPATGDTPARLAIQAPRHLVYAELVTPGAPFADYDVLPAMPEARLEKKLTAVLGGVVTDGAGKPRPGISVRWTPAQRAAPAVVPGRRVLEGAALQLSPVVTAGADGVFRLETNDFGPGKLSCANGDAIDAEAVPGRRTDDLRLTTR